MTNKGNAVKKRTPINVPRNTDVKDHARTVSNKVPSAPTTTKKAVRDATVNPRLKSASAPAASVKKTLPEDVTNTTESGEKKKKKKRKPAPTYNLAKQLAEGKEIPGLTDKPQQAVPRAPKRAPIGAKATSMPKPEEISELPQVPKTTPGGVKKPGALPAKKEKTYHPDAKIPTRQFRQQQQLGQVDQQGQQQQGQLGQQGQRGQQGGRGVADGALGAVNGVGQQGLGAVGQVGGNLPIAGKAVGGATQGVGKTLDGATRGVGNTLNNTTGALGRGDIGGTVGGATKGVGDTVGGLGKGLVSPNRNPKVEKWLDAIQC